jgi:hypothetical protein
MRTVAKSTAKTNQTGVVLASEGINSSSKAVKGIPLGICAHASQCHFACPCSSRNPSTMQGECASVHVLQAYHAGVRHATVTAAAGKGYAHAAPVQKGCAIPWWPSWDADPYRIISTKTCNLKGAKLGHQLHPAHEPIRALQRHLLLPPAKNRFILTCLVALPASLLMRLLHHSCL